MSHGKPKLNAAGHVEAGGASYRIVDDLRSGRYTVVRDGDGVLMGAFKLDAPGDLPGSAAVDAESLDPELVLAIAQLMALPRGALPLQ